MAEKKINLQINYNSDLSSLDKDLKKIESFKKRVENLEVSIPVSLDLGKLDKQGLSAGVNLAKSISKGLSSAGADIANGVKLVDAGSVSDVAQAADKVGGVIKRVVKESNEGLTNVTSEVRQLERGLKQVSKVTTVTSPNGIPKVSKEFTTEDVRNVTDFNSQLRGINSFRGEDFSRALKLKDASTQMKILNDRAVQLKNLLSSSSGVIGGSADFEKGIDQQRKLAQRISATGAGVSRDKDLSVFRSAVKQVNGISGKGLGKALELKDTNAEMKILGDQALELRKILSTVGRQGLGDTSEFKRVEGQIERIDQRLVRLATGGSIKKFEGQIGEVRKEFAGLLGKAEGRSSLEVIDVLTSKASRLRKLLSDGESRGLLNTAAFKAADRELTSINAKVEKLTSSSRRKGFGDASSKRIENIERERNEALKLNKIEGAKANAISETSARETALNAVYEKRLRILQESLNRFNRVGKAAQRVGRQDVVDKVDRRVASDNNSINQIELDRTRGQSEKVRKSRERSLSSGVSVVRDSLKHELAVLDVNTKQEKVGKSLSEIERIQRDALLKKTAIYNDHIDRLQKISSLARRQGFDGVANRASAGARSIETQAVKSSSLGLNGVGKDVSRIDGLFRKGGKAIDFHSGSLLKNAKTFARWHIAGRLALSVLQSFTAGVEAAVRIDRQFATLRAVFQGTASDAQRLKKETLELAVANGRSSDEAIDASIRFSRLGLTRVQVLKAVETSLVAANVAEISAAEAAEKLSSIYASFKLTVDDLPEVLNRLNSISNRYNVTNKDLFEGISRVAGVAKQAGLELTDLEGIIAAVTGVTGRPGQEAGNALKFVISKIRKPQTLEKLRETFGIDLTDATGNIKQFSDILDELATIYPTLTRSQQSYFLELTAGSRQSARFAEVLNEYTTAQSLTAEAAFDSGSAYRENEKILGSLDAQLKRVVASWDQLFVAIGDTGLLDAVATAFNNIANEIQNAIAYLDEFESRQNKDKKLETKVTGRAALSVSRTIQANESVLPSNIARFAASDKASLADLKKQLSLLNQAKSALDTGGVFAEFTAALGRAGDVVTAGGGPLGFVVNKLADISSDDISVRDLTARGDDEVNLAIKQTREAIAELDKKTEAARVDSLGDDFAKLTNRLKGVDKATEVFERLNNDLKNGSKTRSQFIRDWDIASKLLFNLDKGSVVFANNFSKIRSQLEAGDFKGAVESTSGFAKSFKDLKPSLKDDFLDAQAKQSAKLEKELIKVQSEIDKTAKSLGGVDVGSKQYQSLNKQLTELIAKQKEFQDSLLSVKTAFKEDIKPGISSNQLNNVKNTLDEAFKISEALGKSLESTLNGGSERQFERSLAVLEMQRELADAILQGTVDTAARNIAEARDSGADDEVIREVEDREKSLVNLASTRLREVEGISREKAKEIELQRQIKQIEEAREEGVKRANSEANRFSFGLTETDKLTNRSVGLADSIERDARDFELDELLDNDDPLKLEQDRATVLQKEKLLKSDLNALEQRGSVIEAQRVQKSLELIANLKKQREEVSKRLALASREDQLRAARLNGAIENRGSGLTNDEFSFLSQASRQNASQFNPDAVAGLNPVRAENEKQVRRLVIEQGKLSQVIPQLKDRLLGLSSTVSEFNKRIATNVEATVLQDSLNKSENIFNLTLGGFNFEADLSQHIGSLADIILPRVNAKIDSEFTNLKAAIESQFPVDSNELETNPAVAVSQ